MTAPKIYLTRKIPGVRRQKTEYEEQIDGCIPEAADAANIRLKTYERRNKKATNDERKKKLTLYFLEEMKRIAHERGFRRSRIAETRVLFKCFSKAMRKTRKAKIRRRLRLAA